jgi:hypothetical protein
MNGVWCLDATEEELFPNSLETYAGFLGGGFFDLNGMNTQTRASGGAQIRIRVQRPGLSSFPRCGLPEGFI